SLARTTCSATTNTLRPVRSRPGKRLSGRPPRQPERDIPHVAFCRAQSRHHLDLLPVPVRPRVIVRPRNVGGVAVVRAMAVRVRIWVPRVEVVRCAHTAQVAHRTPKIHMISRNEQPPASFSESRNPSAIARIE